MFEELNVQDEPKQGRRLSSTRTRAPRASSAPRYGKKTAGFAGAHRRRNKHWNW